jgi:hypothetical protein
VRESSEKQWSRLYTSCQSGATSRPHLSLLFDNIRFTSGNSGRRRAEPLSQKHLHLDVFPTSRRHLDARTRQRARTTVSGLTARREMYRSFAMQRSRRLSYIAQRAGDWARVQSVVVDSAVRCMIGVGISLAWIRFVGF